ncbi:hypothetical protein EDC94DRAFT_600095 [Helicostylum pulchrum]|nr:hypothetical protein EDC94DRAFT_600095 [Helicostylum pulchrum]
MKFSATLFIFAFFALTTNALPASSVTQENGPGGVVNHVEGPGAISSSHSESITRITTNDGESIVSTSSSSINTASHSDRININLYYAVSLIYFLILL